MAADPNVDPFASIGGGVYKDGGWTPAGMGGAQTAPGAVPGSTPPAPGAGTTPTSVGDQGVNAQTYSQTPGAAPTQSTANQGTQDVVRNSYLQQATQGTTVDTQSPEFRQQVDPYAAAQERARRQYESSQAERLSAKGMGGSGQMDLERRFAAEKAGQNTGMFEAQLVGRELQNKRSEIQNALQQLGNTISGDQQRALQMELAKIDAQLKQAGLDLQGSLGFQELGLKDKLGTGALNVDMMRALLQNQQFGQNLGFNIADREAHWNNQALQYLF
jgi:hypothetical protein